MAEAKATRGNGEASLRVNFDYIKASHFRVIHMDGAVGAVTPNGHINMSLFSERPPLPRRMVHELKENALGDEIKDQRVTRDAIIREMDVDVIMTIDVAESLRTWLRDRIEEANERLSGEKNSEQKT